MELRNDTKEMLSGFESRMRFVNIIKHITQYTKPINFNCEKDCLDNMIIAILVYIMDYTLRCGDGCKFKDIAEKVNEMQDVFNVPGDSHEITKFIIIDIIQNGGKLREFSIYDSRSNSIKKTNLRLIGEEKGIYHLTDDAYDFLFRTKEIDSELDFSVARFKLGEFLKRGNYTAALNQSRELVNRIKTMKLSIIDFENRCRENISNITVDEYEKIKIRIRNLLEEEYEQLDEIQKNALKTQSAINEAIDSGLIIEKYRKSKKEIEKVIHNISVTISEQRSLINKKDSLSILYGKLIDESFKIKNIQRFSFYDEIIKPIENDKCDLNDIKKLFIFLSQPHLKSWFSIENFYVKQKDFKDEVIDRGLDISTDLGEKEDIFKIRNIRYIKIIENLFNYFKKHSNFYLYEYINSLSEKDISDFCNENCLLDVLFALYENSAKDGLIDIAKWKTKNEMALEPLGEFDLPYCLYNISANLLDLKEIKIYKEDREDISFFVKDIDCQRKIRITDFKFEVL